MKILLIGEKYSANLGDGVICEVTQWLLHSLGACEISVLDLSGRTEYALQSRNTQAGAVRLFNKAVKVFHRLRDCFPFLEYHVLRRFSKNALAHIDAALAQHDDAVLAVFAGGQLLSGHFAFQIARIVEILSEKNIPVVFHACGTGRLFSPRLASLLRRALCDPIVKQITSRDDVDYINRRLLSSDRPPAQRTCDPAVFAGQCYGIAADPASQTVGLGVMDARDVGESALIDFWCGITAALDAQGRPWQFFCNGNGADYALIEKILRRLGKEQQPHLAAPRPLRPAELTACIARYKSILSFRLHSHIIAYSLQIPSVAVVWDEKLRFFFAGIAKESRCMGIEASAADMLKELARAQEEGYDKALRAQNEDRVRTVLQEARGAARHNTKRGEFSV